MSVIGYGIVVVGIVFFAIGYARARDPWRRYRGLKAQDANAARYRAWRGGARSASESKTGASVAMALLRREVRLWAAVAALGVGLVAVGYIVAAS
jgi:hypothetical protein